MRVTNLNPSSLQSELEAMMASTSASDMTTLKSESQARCGEHRTRSRQAVPSVSLKLNEVSLRSRFDG